MAGNLKLEIKLAFQSKSKKPRAYLDENALYDYAVKVLGSQMRTESELRRKLLLRVEPGEQGAEIISAVVEAPARAPVAT